MTQISNQNNQTMNILPKTKKRSTTIVLRYKPAAISPCLQLSKQYLKLKYIVAFITLLPLVYFTPASYSQDLAMNEEAWVFTPREIENTTLIDFKVIYNTGNVYLKWRVKNEPEDGLFIIERSTDNNNFKTIQFKKGIGASICYPLLYCSTDEHPLQGTSYYRLVKTYQDGRFYYSDVVTLVTPQKTIDFFPDMEQESIMNSEYDESNIINLSYAKP